MKSVEEQFEDHIKYIEACKRSLIPGHRCDWITIVDDDTPDTPDIPDTPSMPEIPDAPESTVPNNQIWYTANYKISTKESYSSHTFSSGSGRLTGANDITAIGREQFKNQTELLSITLPNSCQYIYPGAFYNCVRLNQVIFGSGLYMLDENAFYKCTGLTEVILPNGVNTLYNGCFRETGLVTFAIPNSVKSVGMGIVRDCKNLKSLIIGNGVETIGTIILSGCSSLESIYYTGTIDQWESINKQSTWADGMPSSVTVVHCTDGDASI